MSRFLNFEYIRMHKIWKQGVLRNFLRRGSVLKNFDCGSHGFLLIFNSNYIQMNFWKFELWKKTEQKLLLL